MNAIQHSKETQRKWECKNTDNFVLSEVPRVCDTINNLSNDEGNDMQGKRQMKKKLWNPDYSAITPPCLHSKIVTKYATTGLLTTDEVEYNTHHLIFTLISLLKLSSKPQLW